MSTIAVKVSNILKKYSSDEFYQYLKQAREAYYKLTGVCDSDSPEYEARMNSFNDWYIFNYSEENQKKIFVRHFDNEEIDGELAKSFHNVNYSVFKVVKVRDKQVELYDILHDEKKIILKENILIQFVADDIFVGRLIDYQGKTYMLKGVCALPRESFKAISQYSKQIRSKRAYDREESFLLQLERIKLKTLHYSHLNIDQLFKFESLN